MGERVGIVTFLNAYDEIAADGHHYSGCLAIIETDHGQASIFLYATSDHLIQALLTFYAAKTRVTVDFTEAAPAASTRNDLQESRARAQTISDEGPFDLRAIWTTPK